MNALDYYDDDPDQAFVRHDWTVDVELGTQIVAIVDPRLVDLHKRTGYIEARFVDTQTHQTVFRIASTNTSSVDCVRWYAATAELLQTYHPATK